MSGANTCADAPGAAMPKYSANPSLGAAGGGAVLQEQASSTTPKRVTRWYVGFTLCTSHSLSIWDCNSNGTERSKPSWRTVPRTPRGCRSTSRTLLAFGAVGRSAEAGARPNLQLLYDLCKHRFALSLRNVHLNKQVNDAGWPAARLQRLARRRANDCLRACNAHVTHRQCANSPLPTLSQMPAGIAPVCRSRP
jgi:hypothetical protein